jgi:type VI secretion system protein VasI
MLFRRIALLGVLATLVSCGTTAQTAEQPTPTARVVKQVVTQIVVVTQVVTATAKPATPTPKSTTTPKPTAAPTDEPTPTPSLAGKWISSTKASSFDDSKIVTLLLDAENDIEGPSGSVRPSLLVRCQEHAKDVFVYTGMAPDVESGNLDGATVRTRFDKDAATSENTNQSTDNTSLFFLNAEATISDLLKHEQLVFGFTPFSASPAEATFDLHGLAEAIKPLNEACK